MGKICCNLPLILLKLIFFTLVPYFYAKHCTINQLNCTGRWCFEYFFNQKRCCVNVGHENISSAFNPLKFVTREKFVRGLKFKRLSVGSEVECHHQKNDEFPFNLNFTLQMVEDSFSQRKESRLVT